PLQIFNQRTSVGLRHLPTCSGSFEHGGYVRIVELRTFISRYLRRKVTASSVAEVRQEYLGDGGPLPLGAVRKALPGSKGHTWVLSMKEFLAARNREHPASFLNDALGLGMDCAYDTTEAAELLAIVYPATFDAEYGDELRQPNTFDAAWDCENFYISYLNDDGWGRTHSCSNQWEPHRERVHRSLDALSDGFTVESVGVADRPSKNFDCHVDEAVRRLLDTTAKPA
ncbi:MAG TPA: hypothetical protein VGQ76_25970, partial [Thermoanaerobaculia bacterium]|nr:hypothetical protein [Thermoanaerobaculia bacterium]